MKNNIYKVWVMKTARRLAVVGLLLFAMTGSALAQSSERACVIKKRTDSGNTSIHYLAHVYNTTTSTWELQDADAFSPDCIWYTGPHYNHAGTNHNYYFIDDNGIPHFLAAPLTSGGDLYLSTSVPETYLLGNTDQNYYFYDWDGDTYGKGIARGHQYFEAGNQTQCDECGGSWNNDDVECWKVYWVEYDLTASPNKWKLTNGSSYHLTDNDNAARSRFVTITENPIVINSASGGLTELSLANPEMTYSSSQAPNVTISSYTYNYRPAFNTYVFENTTHNYYNSDLGEGTPGNTNSPNTSASSYLWTITGEGEPFLSFQASGHEATSTSSTAPTIYYNEENKTGHKTATLTLTVSYGEGPSLTTQTLTADITVKTNCQNPANPTAIVTYEDVTISWVPTAESYTVSWQKDEEGAPWQSATVDSPATSYTITTGLEKDQDYNYKVKATCDPDNPEIKQFHTKATPKTLVYGAVFGGGRMADVGGKTEVVIINCEEISAVYGGNDIAGEVQGSDGSTITLGVNTGGTFESYGITKANIGVNIGSVYGGGNGYYAYNGTSFVDAATSGAGTVPGGASVMAQSLTGEWSVPMWTNPSTNDSTLIIPTIVKTAVVVDNEYVKVDSLFGGAKNAFLTLDDDGTGEKENGSSITVNNGTVFALFGGNNYGGTQGTAQHHIEVIGTTLPQTLGPNLQSTATTGFGRDFGIRYLFGGGNKVFGSTTDIVINGGLTDTIFGGGNSADVTAANVLVNCSLGDRTGDYTYGNTYTNAIDNSNYSSGSIGANTLKENYAWDGNGLYNVHTLFGGNNKADMAGLPTVTLTSGSVGTVYGGGNAGDMKASTDEGANGPIATDFGAPTIDNGTYAGSYNIYYSTHVKMKNAPTMLVDYLYGGCQMSNVDYSTWVEIMDGHVGTVYGGCNISGDVGSNSHHQYGSGPSPTYEENQYVQGATYVKASGGTIYKNLFAGSNGRYHCNDGIYYIEEGIDFADPEHHYIGMSIPTHNETHVMVSDNALVKGNVYAGGNMAPVGFTDYTSGVAPSGKQYPRFLGLASVRMTGGTVEGNVYGGGNMASIYGSNEVKVSGGTIGYTTDGTPTYGALYGGNDQAGQVAQMSNRVFPAALHYDVASDGNTSLAAVHTYVSLTGKPRINTVYGGGNGAYTYTSSEYCDVTDKPIQTTTFVDINIDGYPNENTGGHINTVFGGGNGVTVTGGITVFLNINGDPNNGNAISEYDHIGTIFGGNNEGHLSDVLPDIILLHGQVNTVYGGCNQGAMVGSFTVDNTYTGVGSMVRLRSSYTAGGVTDTPTAVVSNAVYGGCRMNGVTNNSLVLVEGGSHPDASIFGGSDISGDVAGTSRVVVTGGTVGDVYGGGNGEYDYEGHNVYVAGSDHNDPDNLVATNNENDIVPPYCNASRVDMQGGTATNLYAGGYAGECGITTMQVDGGSVSNSVFGGGNMAGVTTSHALTITTINAQSQYTTSTSTSTTLGTSTVNINGGSVVAGIYGGCNSSGNIAGAVNVNIMGGTLGTATNAMMTNGIYGGGYGASTTTSGNVTVTVGDNTHTPTIYADIYGGSALGKVNGSSSLTLVDFESGTLYGKLYGGGMGSTTIGAVINGNVQVDLNGGTFYDNIYGGCNVRGNVTGDVQVNVNCTVGVDGTAHVDVFGGGYGENTTTSGNVEVNVANASSVVYGDVYGGSGYGNVNLNASNTTTVNILDGFIKKTTISGTTYGGNVYGGGLGQKAGFNGTSNIEAKEWGVVHVNIGAAPVAPATAYTGNATIEGMVYGCNNFNGSPQDNVFVNIYKTAHGDTPETNLYPTVPPLPYTSWSDDDAVNALAANAALPQDYAIEAVYGGGNLAAYTPVANKSTTVHVYTCENTIRNVFGGGNAADVGTGNATTLTVTQRANTNVIIEGGRIHRVIGGGNGENLSLPAANIFGTASTTVYAGLIDEVYGGANIQGSVDEINLTMSNPDSPTYSGCANYEDEVYGMVFGCANAAPYNKNVTTTVECGVGIIGELYGGSNQNYIGSSSNHNSGVHVTLNLYGGEYLNVFAGSKGIADDPNTGEDEGVAADIYGDVTLNLYGGKVTNAFGGSDANGNITGLITVNVLDFEETNCGLDVTNIYGASNQTAYSPDDLSTGGKPVSPVVNVMHVSLTDGVRGNVFGGGNEALVTSNPEVNIGYYATTMSSLIPTNYPATSSFYTTPRGYVKTNVYGGGNEAGVTGNPVINMRANGTVVSGIYGGCNTNGDVDGNIFVNIYGGTLGTSTTTPMTQGIFGGGRGHATGTNGNTTVTINKETSESTAPEIYADVYGGSALGEVGAANMTAKVHLINGIVNGNIYGGGMGEGTSTTTQATVSGNTNVTIEGGALTSKVNGYVYGGCNINGNVVGSITVNSIGGTVSQDLFGGGQGSVTTTQGNVKVTINGGTIGRDVYGGSALGQVNSDDEDLTEVWLKGGTVTGNLYGGGMGQDGHSTYGQVNGHVEVYINSGTVNNVFGCNNLNGAPQSSVQVNINEMTRGTMHVNGNVYGGGNQATYGTAGNNYPVVNLLNGTLTHDVFGGGLGDAGDATKGVVTGNPQVVINGANMSVTGDVYGGGSLAPTQGNPLVTMTNGATTNLYGGGKAADVTGNPTVLVTGGTVSTGIYGGNNTSGTVTGNTAVNIKGGTIGTSSSTANIHGGGFGQSTKVTGNVSVNFGEVTYNASGDEIHTPLPLLYGDIYGGSALGNVNTADENVFTPTTNTTVNILNGQIEGNVYGGGLGQKDGVNGTGNIEAKVWGVVHVYIGAAPGTGETDPTGMASLINCSVYGCNNFNGSPQQNVHVDVYKTNHITTDLASYTDEHSRTYAIKYVFGGGNRANYHPDQNPGWEKRTHNYIHTCDNTVEIVYGGGNAADCDGVWLTVDGGRFDFVFGGGNGQVIPANVGEGSAIIFLKGGLIGWYFQGCNLQGDIQGIVQETQGCTGPGCCDIFTVEKYYFGANEATIYDGLDSEIKCEDAANFHFTYVYAGSRLAVIYGDIKLTVKGGDIRNLFGGSEGSEVISADVRKYPEDEAGIALLPSDHQEGVRNHLLAHPEDRGKGGNIYLTLEGGTLTNVFGGCDDRGLIEGEIIVTVNSTQTLCPLNIDNIYGGNNFAEYRPSNASIISPRVLLLNGRVNQNVFGGSRGNDASINTEGKITSNPKVVVGDLITGHQARVGGDVYGGGSSAEVVGNTQVVLKGKTERGVSTTQIDNNVYGGGKRGTVTGNTDVTVVKTNPMFFFTQLHNTIRVTDSENHTVSSGDEIAPGTVLNITVTSARGYNFTGWVPTGGTVADANAPTTTFTMGDSDAMLKANFVATHTLTMIADPTEGGSFTVNGEAYSTPVTLNEGSTATIVATPSPGYTFSGWTVTGNGSSVNSNTATTTFTMGSDHAILTATFTPTTP